MEITCPSSMTGNRLPLAVLKLISGVRILASLELEKSANVLIIK
jgi:hypothetical protein